MRSIRLSVRTRFAIPLALAALLFANVSAAYADTVQGEETIAAEKCKDELILWGPPGSVPLPSQSNIQACLNYLVNAQTSVVNEAIKSANSVNQTANAKLARNAGAGDLLDGILGTVVSQVEQLTGLEAGVKVSYTCCYVGAQAKVLGFQVDERVGFSPDLSNSCLLDGCWFPTSGSNPQPSSTGDSTSNFRYSNQAILYWSRGSGGSGNLDGRAMYTLYEQSYKPREESDFWATSQKASVTPRNGKRMTEVYTNVSPAERGLQLSDADPFSVNEYGSAGSFSLGASLSGEYRGAGGSFSIGRTWNYPRGYNGGGFLSSGEHYGLWRLADGDGDQYAKGAQGVETWRSPTNAYVGWNVGATATYH